MVMRAKVTVRGGCGGDEPRRQRTTQNSCVRSCVAALALRVLMLFLAFVLSRSQDLEQNSETARVLSDALPFIQAHADRTVVIKYGGHAMEDEEASLSFAQDVVMLKQVQYLTHNWLS